MSITLVLADDHQLLLDGLERMLSCETGLSVLARCNSGEAALRAVREHEPDVLILDLRLPGMGGLDVLRELHGQAQRPRVVLFTASVTDQEVTEAIRLGVRGIVLKAMASEVLVRCIREVHAGGRWLDRAAVARALDTLLMHPNETRRLDKLLSAREIDVLRLVARGSRNKEIARALGVTEGTVKTHVHSVYEKTGVDSRVDLAAWAKARGLA